VGNYTTPWRAHEEVVLIVEATNHGRGYFAVVSLVLDEAVDVQDLGCITLVSISEMRLDDKNIIGYSLYKDDTRLNAHVLTTKGHVVNNDVLIRPVFRGGYETVYANFAHEHNIPPVQQIPTAFSFSIYPNPCAEQTHISYALPYTTNVSIDVYDMTGRHVKQLVSQKHAPGYYSVAWNTVDKNGRVASCGVYFVRILTGQDIQQEEILLVR
jgi:hypothetical protein